MSHNHAHGECGSTSSSDDKIKAIAADVFHVDASHIELEMGPDDVDAWDSMNHLRLITEIESAFSMQLTMQQIQGIETLRDLASFVSQEQS